MEHFVVDEGTMDLDATSAESILAKLGEMQVWTGLECVM